MQAKEVDRIVSEPLPGYRITRQVGVGTGSKISTCTDLRTGKTYAVKHVVRNSAEDDTFIQQAENEFAVSSKIDDVHVRRSPQPTGTLVQCLPQRQGPLPYGQLIDRDSYVGRRRRYSTLLFYEP